MNGKREILLQATAFLVVWALSFVLLSKEGWTPVWYSADVLAIPVILLLAYNLVATFLWWSKALFRREVKLSAGALLQPKSILLIIASVGLISAPFLLDRVERNRKERIIESIVGAEFSDKVEGYRILVDDHDRTILSGSQISNLSTSRDSVIVHLVSGDSYLMLFTEPAGTIAVERLRRANK